ncbi:hypothetical protein CBW24_01435 [Pacificitalea manganoxidans]|uniref:HTH lysR-type domain-containing protein n=1 Tax=Pacificitalea manganoxidans TaxID=1411902 RepID=A0A291LVQ1_9RHOB|nr:LysR substrate-binding domain-containing protein [Pacificitalea manganoxidans]ATI40803.1 hypothetical protein CBW24_01435 [Pacificitalea manganoxidans]MBF53872.1 LysR family transcriptional regulator [Actibacterium sp.]MDR6309812.1 LysR family glycine cleavage system transcriptional activator [Pacificitalea manganoxidans]
MDWRNIPSLSALRAFEAVARHESFTEAARDLNVTHAALSQHVRALEGDFSVDLVRRSGRGVVLTDAGRQLAAGLADGFGAIADTVAALREDQADRPLAVALTPSFAEHWLMPRLGAFWAAYPGVELSLQPGTALVEPRTPGVDVAVRWGRGGWPGWHETRLPVAHLVIVGPPKLLPQGADTPPETLKRLHWFLDATFAEGRTWAESLGLMGPETAATLLPTTGLLLSAVRAGYGLSVVPRGFVADDIRAGRMVPLVESDDSGLSYFLLCKKDRNPPGLAEFSRWMLQTAAAEIAEDALHAAVTAPAPPR